MDPNVSPWAPSPATIGKPILLIVDDQSTARLSLRFMFESEFDIIEAERAPEALDLIRQHQGDIAAGIFDLKLAGVSGLDLLREAKVLDPLLQVVILTGYETVAATKTAMHLGAIDVLTKPPDMTDTLDAVQRACKAHQTIKDQQTRERYVGEILALLGSGGLEDIRTWQEVSQDIGAMITMLRRELESIGSPASGGAGAAEKVSADLAIARRHAEFIQQCWRWGNAGGAGAAAEPETPSVHELVAEIIGLLQFHPDAAAKGLILMSSAGRNVAGLRPMLIVQLVWRLLLDSLRRGVTQISIKIAQQSARNVVDACLPESILVCLPADVLNTNTLLSVVTIEGHGQVLDPTPASPVTHERGKVLQWAAAILQKQRGFLAVSAPSDRENEIVLAFP